MLDWADSRLMYSDAMSDRNESESNAPDCAFQMNGMSNVHCDSLMNENSHISRYNREKKLEK